MFPIFYDRVIGYKADKKIIRKTDPIWQDNFQGLSQFCPEGDRDRDDYWCRQFLQIARDTSAINTIINEWPLNGDQRETVGESLRNSPYHLAIVLEHYCEKATEQVYLYFLIFQFKKELMENHKLDQRNAEKIAKLRANNQLAKQRIKAPVGFFKQVLVRTNQHYQDPSEESFLFKQIELIHQCTVFAKFDLKRNNYLENWAVYWLYKQTVDEIIRKYDTERRDNPWRELYYFCMNFSQHSPKERQSTLNRLEIPENNINYFTELILVFAQMYVREQEIRNGRPQPRYREPNNEQLQGMAQEFNRCLSFQKNGQEIKNQLLGFYQTYLSNDPPLNIDTLDSPQENDNGSESTKDVDDSNIPPSPEATELKEKLPSLIDQLDNTVERPYQVLLLLYYSFKDRLFMAEDEEGNVQLNETEIGIILDLSGDIQVKVSRRKEKALKKLTELIFKNDKSLETLPIINGNVSLDLKAIAELKKWLNKEKANLSVNELINWFEELQQLLDQENPLSSESLEFIKSWILQKGLLEKQLLPDYYFSLIRSWIVDDLAKIPITAIIDKIPERPNEELHSLKVKVREKITEEIKNAGFDLSPEGLALLECPINRLVEVYARVTPEQP